MMKRDYKENIRPRKAHVSKAIDSYAPHEELIKYLNREDRTDNNIDSEEKKENILNDIVFPSMANVTVFLEYCANSDLIYDEFREEINELLMGTNQNTDAPKYKRNQSVLQRFVNAAFTCLFH
jgi:hypothetical protein